MMHRSTEAAHMRYYDQAERSPIRLRPDRTEAYRVERRSWARALAAQALSDYGRGRPEQILRDYFPLDDRAARILKSAVSPTKSSDFPPTDVVASFRSLAPASAAWKLFDHPSALKLDLTGYHQINIPHLSNLPPGAVFVAEAAPGPVLQWSPAP
jgi:hypothetical protein